MTLELRILVLSASLALLSYAVKCAFDSYDSYWSGKANKDFTDTPEKPEPGEEWKDTQ